MNHIPIYTIGHGTRKAEDFLLLLKTYGILYLADVRSRPYSRFNPQYNREQLDGFLSLHDIKYVFMGDELGGRPGDPDCYDENGKINYDILAVKSFFESGIERLKTAYAKRIPLAIMCSEGRPAACHRSKLIGKTLLRHQVPVMHINEKGMLQSQEEIMYELNKGFSGNPLFPPDPDAA